MANVPQLLYGQSPKILTGNKDGLFADFLGFYCKSSKRIRRRIGYAATNRRSLINKKCNAVLDLQRGASNASRQSSDIVPKVCLHSMLNFYWTWSNSCFQYAICEKKHISFIIYQNTDV